MLSARFSLSRIGTGFLDAVMIGVLGFLGMLWSLALALALAPDMSRMLDECTVVLAGWVVFGLVIVGQAVSKRLWRLVGVGLVLVAGMVGWQWLRAQDLGAGDAAGLLAFQVGTFGLCVAVLCSLRRVALRRGWFSGTSRLVLVTCLTGYLVYLAWDEPVAASIARNQAALAGRFEDESTALLTLRYSPAPGGGRVFTAPPHVLVFDQKGEKRREYLLAHRAEIEANWTALSEVRAWCAEMAAQPQLGDRHVTRFDQPIVRFPPLRAYTQHALAIAALQALDGKGDDALATVAGVYEVGARLEPASFTLIRCMIARHIIKQALETTEFVLEHAEVSPAARARFSTLLEESKAGAHMAKLFVLTEAPFWSKETIGLVGVNSGFFGDGFSTEVLRLLNKLWSPVILNSQATVNWVHIYYEDLAVRAAARDLEGMRAADERFTSMLLGGFSVKNLAGRRLANMGAGTFVHVAKTYWATEDLRAALIQRLRESRPAQ
jgi:hypothetical protein